MKKCNILVVEDEALIAANLIDTLSSLGYNVPEPVATGEDAIRAVKARQPDLVLMDIQLIGEMDGIVTAEKIRAIADIPIVYLTAYSEDLRLKQARLTEPYGYIVKPAHSRELHATIEMALYKHALDKKLKESEEKYRDIFENSVVGLFQTAPSGRMINLNNALARMYGFSDAAEMLAADLNVGNPPYANPEDHLEVRHILAEKGKVENYEALHLKRDGARFWVAISARIKRDTEGNVLLYEGTVIDITERKRDEETIRQANKRLRRFVDANIIGVIIASPSGKVIDANDYYLNLIGYTREELEKGEVDWRAVTPPEWLTADEHALEDLHKKGVSTPYEKEYCRRDGTRVSVLLSDAMLPGPEEQIIAFVTDITERKQAEEALAASEEKYRTHIEQSLDGIIISDEHGNVAFWNRSIECITGIPHCDAIRKTIWEMMYRLTPDELKTPELLENLKNFVKNILESQMSWQGMTGEQIIQSADGSRKVVQENSFIFQTRDGAKFGASVRDITERKRAEEALRQANKKLNLLSSITRHDINNQMTALRGYTTLLQRKQPDSSFAEYFQKINAASERISSMIRFTKEYEQIGAHASIWQDTRTLVDTAAKQATLGKITVNNDLPAGTEIFADPLVVKVFYNLMDNAVRYGGKITFIRFSAEKAGDEHIIVCEDDGDGIPADEKDKIFERGFGKNTGLGLALSREILDITGITIKETGEPGKGARFVMVVPKGIWRMRRSNENHV